MELAILNVGKINMKFMAAAENGKVLETLSHTNPVFPDHTHHNLELVDKWLTESLAKLAALPQDNGLRRDRATGRAESS